MGKDMRSAPRGVAGSEGVVAGRHGLGEAGGFGKPDNVVGNIAKDKRPGLGANEHATHELMTADQKVHVGGCR
jgi:hypothetical protein